MISLASILAATAFAPVLPAIETEPVAFDADDPAIWIHSKEPDKSLVLGTDKKSVEGGVFVFDLKGKAVQTFKGIDRPNNIDVEYGFELNRAKVDLAVATERGKKRLRIWAIDRSSGRLTDVTGNTTVFKDRKDEQAVPMGLSLYACRKDKRFYALVSPKGGPKQGYLHLYRLEAKTDKVDAVFVRALGRFSGDGEIEAVVVDDRNDVAYYSDESYGIRKVSVLPDSKTDNELASFGTEGYKGDREGLAIWRADNGMAYLLNIDQTPDSSTIHVYDINGDPYKLGSIPIASDSTDGLDAANNPLGDGFHDGLVVAMNSRGKNFHYYRPGDLIKRLMESLR